MVSLTLSVVKPGEALLQKGTPPRKRDISVASHNHSVCCRACRLSPLFHEHQPDSRRTCPEYFVLHLRRIARHFPPGSALPKATGGGCARRIHGRDIHHDLSHKPQAGFLDLVYTRGSRRNSGNRDAAIQPIPESLRIRPAEIGFYPQKRDGSRTSAGASVLKQNTSASPTSATMLIFEFHTL